MSREAYRSSPSEFSPRGERWDRERFVSERERYDERSRYYDEDDRYYTREARAPPPRPRPTQTRPYDDDYVVRDRRHYWEEEPQYSRQRSPPTQELERKVVIERERLRSPSPPRRPGQLLRRQSSLDTFDRRPARFYEREQREEYGPPARREDFRPPPNVPIPLPRTRALPPPRRYAEREYYDEIRVSDPDYYGDEEYHQFPERVREREVVRTRRRNRDRSRESHSTRTTTTRSSSRSSSVTSRSSSSSGGTTVKSAEYPKKGKTRIPGRLVSKRALIDLRYPFIEEGNTIVVQKALGQDNIDELLKLSEEYKKSELEIEAARSHAGDIIEERREEFIMAPPVPAVPIAVPVPAPAPPPAAAPVIIPAAPMPPPAPVEVVNTTTVIRDVSPARSATTSTSYSSDHSHVVVDARPREFSDAVAVGPLALVQADRHRHRSHSRGERRLIAEVHGHGHEHHHHHRHGSSSKEIVTAERLPNGELVLYEERVEKIEAPRKGLRIEKDKKGPPPKLVRAMLATLT